MMSWQKIFGGGVIMRTIAIISIVFISLMMSCKDNSLLPEPIEHEPLIPLSVGNFWLYLEYDLNPDGTGGIPRLWKFGFIIQNSPTRSTSELNSTVYLMSRCDEDMTPFDDT